MGFYFCRFLELDAGEVEKELDKILKEVSRSFYVTLRCLPKAMRAPTSVGYLLARLSDTIADAGDVLVGDRMNALERFREAVFLGGGFLFSAEGVSEGEKRLLKRADGCLEVMRNLPKWQQQEIRRVVGTIIEGQSWDLTRFKKDGVVRLERDEELRTYTYQVAGCVGEFWTALGFGLGEFASEEKEQMDQWGRSFGRALQLINILRDVPEDLEMGRCYLPGEEEVSPEILLHERGRWIAEAREGLERAEKYAAALYGKRLRFATVLPALVGRETLCLLEESDWEAWQARVKVARGEMKGLMWEAARFAL